MKVYSIWRPSPFKGQVFRKESMADQLADEPLDRIFERFVMSGRAPAYEGGEVDIDANDADVDAAMSDSALDDVSQMSRLERLDVLATAERLVEQLRESSVSSEKLRKTEAKATGANDASKDSGVSEKNQPTPQNG